MQTKTNNSSERLFELISHLKLSYNKLAEEIGLDKNTKIYHVKNGRNEISSDLAKIITDRFKDISYEWLLTGKGEMLKEAPKEKSQPNEVTPIPYENYMEIEYADLSTAAGKLGVENPAILPKTKKRLLPREFEKGNYLVVKVDGDSMDNGTSISIPDGTEILIKECFLDLEKERLPIRGNLFVIVATTGTVFKQIVEQNVEEGYIMCHSYNNMYKDYKIEFSEILQIFIYRKVVSYRPSIPEF